MIRIGICGAGFMGKMHSACYAALPGCKVTAVANPQAKEAQGVADKHGAKIFRDAKSLIRSGLVDVVDICLPTYLHCDHVLLAAEKGLDCVCEKPLARTLAQAERMVKAVKKSKIKFMTGHVIRFWPEYVLLKKIVDDRRFGKLASLELRRFGGKPFGWQNWFRKPKLSGGAMLDLHIHDTDYVLHLLGEPSSVESIGVKRAGSWEQVSTQFRFPGTIVNAEGGWWDTPEPFCMSFRAVFDRAIISWSFADGKFMLYETGKKEAEVKVPQPKSGAADAGGNISNLGGYYAELKYYLDCVKAGRRPETATVEDARDTLALIFRETASAERNLKK